MNERIVTVQEVPNSKRNKIEYMPDPYFRPLIGGLDIGIIAETSEIVYIAGLGYKYLGHNTSFTMFVCRMLGIKSRWSEQ